MNRIRSSALGVVLASVLLVALNASPSHASSCKNEPTCNPMCSGKIIIVHAGVADTFTTAGCSYGAHYIPLLGSSSGLAYDNGNGVSVSLIDSDGNYLSSNSHNINIGSAAELWLTGTTVSNGNLSSPLRCIDPDVPGSLDGLPYIQQVLSGGPSIVYPSFGGTGDLQIQIKMGSGNYAPLGIFFSGRSTDIDADGDTDEDDEALMRTAIAGSGGSAYDLNWSGPVDSLDLAILLTEAARHTNGALCTDGYDMDGIPGSYDMNRNAQYAPATTSNLSVTRLDASTVRLSWTQPADDGSSGRAATAYDVRRSASAISSTGAFNGATGVSSPPTPGTPGSTVTMDVALAAGTSQYFALRTKDDVDNWSGVSNSPQIQDTAPDAITGLGASPGRYVVKLSWTAPGEDGSFGTASAYDIRYITSGTISESNWGSATVVGSVPSPGVAGTSQCLVVDQLDGCTQYSFAIKTQDAAGHWSSISNVKSATTKCSGSLSFECGGTSLERPRSEATETFEFALNGFQPNPARAGGEVSYSIPGSAAGQRIDLSVFDVSGRRQATLASGMASPGRFSVRWGLKTDAGDRVQPGVYFMRLRLGESVLNRPMIVAP